ncbi:MarR family winged helix-turn-helix transcriptional regulator [Nitrospirillum sp. BR 11163]|uniref:MarR family winged helix-turn-helix transcriptional regulator n=1 Tax=Nitrospirillum sp. BR 11163 TaxID=3104323 RepID=UPI002AFF9D54|nr:MarR family winged helix-turn-helix transcriptional regulator [Nitrospirillum sp. BR 11163]MEA1674264.1 MarR family winged helix-turn-helix transcriptional regulator [Nitrospirillum sp. BR 11163]
MTANPNDHRHRQRSAPLAALEAMRAVDEQFSLQEACGFLYICENEGISLRELGLLLRAQPHTVSRIVARLSTGFGNRASDLVEARTLHHDNRVRTLHLTERGRTLCRTLNSIVLQAVPILDDGEDAPAAGRSAAGATWASASV